MVSHALSASLHGLTCVIRFVAWSHMRYPLRCMVSHALSAPLVAWSHALRGGPSDSVGGAFGCGTALQAGRSRVRFPMVSLEFFINVIFPVALWPWG